MNEAAPANSVSDRLVVQDDAVALFDTAKFEHMYRIAKLMSSSDLVPGHLKDKEANCMLITQQALRWKMDPFALAVGTFVVSNKLGYEGKVVAAVVNTRAKLKERLKYDISGKGQECSVVVRGTFSGETEERTVDAYWAEGAAMSPHGAKWKQPGMESQQLCYYAVRKWARRHCPELILGVLSDDEVEAMSQNFGPDHAKEIGGHSEVPRAVDLAAEGVDLAAGGVKGTGTTKPMIESGVVDTETGEIKEKKTTPSASSDKGPTARRPRVKLMFGGKEVYQTGFINDVKKMLDTVNTWEALENLQATIGVAIATVGNAGAQKKIADQIEPMIEAVQKEFETEETAQEEPLITKHAHDTASAESGSEELDLA